MDKNAYARRQRILCQQCPSHSLTLRQNLRSKIFTVWLCETFHRNIVRNIHEVNFHSQKCGSKNRESYAPLKIWLYTVVFDDKRHPNTKTCSVPECTSKYTIALRSKPNTVLFKQALRLTCILQELCDW